MANYGSTSVDVTAYHRLEFSWTAAYENSVNYTSQVGWALYLYAGDCAINNVTSGKAWKVIIGGKEYSGTNYVRIAANSSLLLASGVTTIQHKPDGTGSFTYSFSQEFSCSVKTPVGTATLGTFTGDGSGTLVVIGLTASTLSTDEKDPILEKPISLEVVSKHGNKVSHNVKWSCGSSSGDLGLYSSGARFTFTPELKLANHAPNSNHVPITFTITTYNAVNGNALVGTSTLVVEFYIPDKVFPTCTAAVSDPTGIFDKYGYYVKSLSSLKIDITGYPKYGSPIVSYKCAANDGVFYVQSSRTGKLKKSGKQNVKYSVQDARGRRSGETSYTITVEDYSAPKITKLEACRCNENGTENQYGNYIKVTFSASVTALDNQNTATYSLSYKKKTETTYTENALNEYAGQFSVSNGTHIFAADIEFGYDIVLSVTDSHNTSKSHVESTTGFTLLHFGNDGTSVSVGKLSEKPNLFDIGLPTRFNSPIYGSVLGLDYMPPIPENASLSTYLTPGGWSVPTDALAKTISGLPVPVAGRLEVASAKGIEIPAAGEVYIRQKYIPYDTEYSTFERTVYRNGSNQVSFYNWIPTTAKEQKYLWFGSNVMGANSTITLNESVNLQNAIILVFERNWTETDANGKETEKRTIRSCFLPSIIANYGEYEYPAATKSFVLSKSHEKYLNIQDNMIVGNSENETEPNDDFKLIYVIGV